jgi:hypothetical protein
LRPTYFIHTEDGYVLQVYSAEASLRYSIIKYDLAKNFGLSLETHFVHKEDGYVLQVYSTEASPRYSIISSRPRHKPPNYL